MSGALQTIQPDWKQRWRAALPGALLVVMVFLAYSQVWRFAFVWDDSTNIVNSRPLRTLDGLRRIWFEPGATQQYYPLTHSSFWLDYHFWGLNPAAYHVENVLLHATGAVLLWLALKRLGVKGAWLGAALFALHPVNVESVAWVTERKNTMSGVFFMASILAAIQFWHLKGSEFRQEQTRMGTGAAGQEPGQRRYYFLALIFYLCSLWSKTSTVGLPLVIGLLIWCKRGHLKRSEALTLIPFVLVGLGMGLLTMRVEHIRVATTDAVWGGLNRYERLFVTGRAFWFYLWKLAWPHPLMFIYPRWQIKGTDAAGAIGILAAGAIFLLLWRQRREWGRPGLIAGGYFVVLLLPVLGFFSTYFFVYSFVCDHFQYLACIGPLVLAASGMTVAAGRLGGVGVWLGPAVCGSLLVVLGILTWSQTSIYRDPEILWRDTLAHNPDSWLAHDNLGALLCQQGKFDEGTAQLEESIRLNPDDYEAYHNLGLNLVRSGQVYEAIEDFKKALEIKPDFALADYDLGRVMIKQGGIDEGIAYLRRAAELDPEFPPGHLTLGLALAQSGNYEAAIEEYKKTAELWPKFAAAQLAMGEALTAAGKSSEAMDHYKKAVELDPSSVDALVNLGNAFIAGKQLDNAADAYRRAIRILPGNPILHHNLGILLKHQGRDAEAQAELAEARRLEMQGTTSPPDGTPP